MLIIDELDRCRPTYAIEVLEKAKHFFNVAGMVFVLAVDNGQIRHSIKSVYGVGMDVDGYLKRFIDLPYTLPRPKKELFCKALFGRFSLDEYFNTLPDSQKRQDKERFLRIFTELFDILNFSLREQEQCFSQLSIALRTTPREMLVLPYLLGSLLVLKAKNLHLYRGFLYEKVEPGEVIEWIRTTPGGDEFLDDYAGVELAAHLFTCGSNVKAEEQAISRYTTYISGGQLSSKQEERARKVVDSIKKLYFDRRFGLLQYLASKIDLVSGFSDRLR